MSDLEQRVNKGEERLVAGRYVRPCGCLRAGQAGDCYKFRNGPKASRLLPCECGCHDPFRRKPIAKQSYGSMPVVYFVRCRVTGRIKIGTTASFEHRLSTLRTHSPTELDVLGVLDARAWEEAAVHRMFKIHRLHGEWFTGDASLHKFIRQNQMHSDLPL